MKQIYKPKQRTERPSIEYLRMSLGFMGITQLMIMSVALLIAGQSMHTYFLFLAVSRKLDLIAFVLLLSIPLVGIVVLYFTGIFIERKYSRLLVKHGLKEEDCYFYGRKYDRTNKMDR